MLVDWMNEAVVLLISIKVFKITNADIGVCAKQQRNFFVTCYGFLYESRWTTFEKECYNSVHLICLGVN